MVAMALMRSRPVQCGAVLAGVKAKPFGWPSASLDPGCGRRGFGQCRDGEMAGKREHARSHSGVTGAG